MSSRKNTCLALTLTGICVLLGVTMGWAEITPPTVYGGTTGIVTQEYWFSIMDGPPPVAFFVDWGDGTNSGWFVPGTQPPPFYPTYSILYHVFVSTGTYTIQGKSRDPSTLIESNWSNPLIVTIEPLPMVAYLENPPQSYPSPLGIPPIVTEVSGITTIHGWALDVKGITNVELFIDGQFVANIPYGGTRGDVKEAFPNYPNAENSGFATIWNYSILSPGNHDVQLRIHNQDGDARVLGALVVVNKFHGEFVTDVVPKSRLLRNNGVTVDGITKRYDIKIEWSNVTQGFEIVDIIAK